MSIIDAVFFFYMFIGLYMLSLLLFIYFPNRKKLFEHPKGKAVPVSVIIPCYNDGEHIQDTLDSILALDYPKKMIEIIVVDDKSTDNSAEVVREYAKSHGQVRLIINERNSGGAAEPTNIGIRAAKNDFIAVADADSSPRKDALIKMIGFLQNDKVVGGVTCAVLSKTPVTFIQKLQAIEYKIIAFNRKLLDAVDAVYVTPGPFAVYRKQTLLEIGLFDTKNMTQDIEIVWRMLSKGYKARMCLDTAVYSATPEKFGAWFRQRVRWNIGGLQTQIKYKNHLFKQNMLGLFIIPFFSFSLFIGVLGLGLFAYLMFRRIALAYLTTEYSLSVGTALIRTQDLTFTPSVLNFFGLALFFLSIGFTFVGLSIMSADKKDNIFNVLFYVLVYLSVYPFIMLTGMYKYWRKTYSW